MSYSWMSSTCRMRTYFCVAIGFDVFDRTGKRQRAYRYVIVDQGVDAIERQFKIINPAEGEQLAIDKMHSCQ